MAGTYILTRYRNFSDKWRRSSLISYLLRGGRLLHKNHFLPLIAKSYKSKASSKIITFAKRIVMDEENKKEILERLNNWGTETLAKTLGIVFTDVSEDSLSATMPVNPKIHKFTAIGLWRCSAFT